MGSGLRRRKKIVIKSVVERMMKGGKERGRGAKEGKKKKIGMERGRRREIKM